jgi:hypothetical protein
MPIELAVHFQDDIWSGKPAGAPVIESQHSNFL